MNNSRKIFDICFKILILLVLCVIAASLFKIAFSKPIVVEKNNTGTMQNPIWVHVETFAEYKARMRILENKLENKYIPSEKELIEFNNEVDIGG